MTLPETRTETGDRNATGLAALALGTTICGAIVMHWLFGEIRPATHDAILLVPFMGGMALVAPDRAERFGRWLALVIHEWRHG